MAATGLPRRACTVGVSWRDGEQRRERCRPACPGQAYHRPCPEYSTVHACKGVTLPQVLRVYL